MRLVSAGEISLCLDARVLTEYAEVLARPKFAFDQDAIAALLDLISHEGQTVAAAPLPVSLPDPDDNPFLEIALSGMAAYLVTGNLAHFPIELRLGVEVVSPAEFVAALRSGQAT